MNAATEDRPLVVVTGGQGGFGSALVDELSAAGCDVRAPGRDLLDVTDADSVSAFFGTLPRCDALINNAGLGIDASISRLRPEDWDRVVATSLQGAWRCSKAVLPIMRRARGGHIVHIGSHVGMWGNAGQAAYAAAKAGLLGLNASIAREYGPSGIASNIVLPGWMETKMTSGVPERVRDAALGQHVLGRFTTPRESARFIAFLLTTRAISGQVFALDSRPLPVW